MIASMGNIKPNKFNYDIISLALQSHTKRAFYFGNTNLIHNRNYPYPKGQIYLVKNTKITIPITITLVIKPMI